MKITFLADKNPEATKALFACIKRYGQADLDKADVVVVLGGDGFMLKILHALLNYQTPVFGLNLGHVGYLLNRYSEDNLPDRIDTATALKATPLRVNIENLLGKTQEVFAFNEVSLQRSTPQAARLKTIITDEHNGQGYDSTTEVFGDGLIVATKMGSSGYYRSAQGKSFKKKYQAMGVQSICSQKPFNRIVSEKGHVCVVPEEVIKRPVHLDKDGQERIARVGLVCVQPAPDKARTLLMEQKQSVR